jgi:uncharacterized protein YkwD
VKATQKHASGTWSKRSLRHYVKQAFVPHKANQYHPHLIRRQGLIGMFVLMVILQMVSFSTANAAANQGSTVDSLLSITNSEREKVGLDPLAANDKLSRAAALKAKDMLKHQYWSHVAPDGATPWRWIDQAGYIYSYAGENLAKNFRTPEAVMAAWMASPEHRANILDMHYSDVGFAVTSGKLDGKPVTLTVALYGAPSAFTATTTASKTEMSPLVGSHIGIWSRINIAGQSMSFASVLSLILLGAGVIVAILTYIHRKKLPKKFRGAWYRHHGLLKAGGMLSFCFIIIFLYGEGQI